VSRIIGIDAGNDSVKVYSEGGADIFPSDLGEYRSLKLTNNLLKDDMSYEYNGVKGFAGTLAQRESEFAASMLGTTKAHPDVLIRVLIALHRTSLTDSQSFNIIVGQPITNHTSSHKERMKEMLIGEHVFTINGRPKKLTIERVEVAAEGASAFWSAPKQGKVRLIDAGSGTVNIATIENGMYIDKESDTLNFGFNTLKSNDIDAFARRVALNCFKKWKRKDEVYLLGGKAEKLLVPMLYHFANSEVLKPIVEENGATKLLPSIFSNAVAFYNIGRKVYGQ
jgi:plasmid segregation protein ParM